MTVPAFTLVPTLPTDWVTRVQSYTIPDFVIGNGEPPPIEWAVQGWAQAGKAGVLVAAGGTGKTTLMLLLAICHATGRPFMGQTVKLGQTLILSNDDTQEDLEVALALVVKAAGLDERECILVALNVVVVSTIGMQGTKTFSAAVDGRPQATDMGYHLQDATADMKDLVLVVLDTARQFAGGQTNDELVMGLLIGGATEFAARRGCYVVIPHHTGKQNYRDGITDMYAGSGSAAIADNSRFLWLLQAATWQDVAEKVQRTGNEDGDPLVLTSTRGSLRVKAPEPIYMARDGYSIQRLKGWVLSVGQQADKQDLDVLRAVRNGAQTKQAIEAGVRGRATETRKRVDDLLLRKHLVYGESSGPGRQKRQQLMVSESGARLLDDENMRDDSL